MLLTGKRKRAPIAEASAVSAAVNVANFVIGPRVNVETDSTMLARLQKLSRENAVLALTHDRILADSPMVECLNETAGKGENACAAVISYVFFERPLFLPEGLQKIGLSLTPYFGINGRRDVFSKDSVKLRR